jgi:transcriptional regulator with XRE-family HTH domain
MAFAFCEAPLCSHSHGPRIALVETWQSRYRKLLKGRGLTQAKLAKKVNRSEGAISQYLSGDRDPDPEMLAKMCAAIGASADAVLGLEPDDRPSREEATRVVGLLEAAGRTLGRYVEKADAVRLADALASLEIALATKERRAERKGRTRPGRLADSG